MLAKRMGKLQTSFLRSLGVAGGPRTRPSRAAPTFLLAGEPGTLDTRVNDARHAPPVGTSGPVLALARCESSLRLLDQGNGRLRGASRLVRRARY